MVASWVRQGLPSDPTSVQNGTILTNSERWPLLLDPQLQGVVWIKERESKNNLQARSVYVPTLVKVNKGLRCMLSVHFYLYAEESVARCAAAARCGALVANAGRAHGRRHHAAGPRASH